jgi:hypothetical protein
MQRSSLILADRQVDAGHGAMMRMNWHKTSDSQKENGATHRNIHTFQTFSRHVPATRCAMLESSVPVNVLWDAGSSPIRWFIVREQIRKMKKNNKESLNKKWKKEQDQGNQDQDRDPTKNKKNYDKN